jgi:antitoxin ParD1/3/4
MTSMNISLPEELKEYVEQQAQGGYSTPSEFVRDLIRRDQKRHAKERLEQLLLEGLESGEPIPTDEAFWTNLKNDALAQIAARKTSREARKRQN